MQHNFMLFSELQKKVSPSPIKTWRLLDRMRTEGRMKEGEDFLMTDRKLYVNVPRFVVEMEQMGYAVKSSDFKNGDVISDDFKKLYEEMRLISDEITHSRIQEEMKSDEMTNTQQNGKVISDEIIHEEPTRKSDGISPTMISPEINLKLPEFNMLLRSKDEIIASKKEQIEDMKEMYAEILKSKDTMLKSKDDELKEVRTALDTVVKQNETLVHQNVFLTRLLTSPKEDRTQHDDVIAHEFRDATEVTPEQEDRAHDAEPLTTPAHEASTVGEQGRADHHTPPDVPLRADPLDADSAPPEEHVAETSHMPSLTNS